MMKISNGLMIGCGVGMIFIVLVTFDLLLFGGLRGCFNVFKGPEDYYKNYHAKGLQQSIDDSITDEFMKQPPSGFLSKGYSREVWDLYWNRRINALYKFEEHSTREHYRGSTGEEFIRYIIEKRRERGLPEINIEERNKPIIEEINEPTRQPALAVPTHLNMKLDKASRL